MISSGINNIFCILYIQFYLGVPCSDPYFLRPYYLSARVLCLIVPVVNFLQDILVILCHSCISSVYPFKFLYLFLNYILSSCVMYKWY